MNPVEKYLLKRKNEGGIIHIAGECNDEAMSSLKQLPFEVYKKVLPEPDPRTGTINNGTEFFRKFSAIVHAKDAEHCEYVNNSSMCVDDATAFILNEIKVKCRNYWDKNKFSNNKAPSPTENTDPYINNAEVGDATISSDGIKTIINYEIGERSKEYIIYDIYNCTLKKDDEYIVNAYNLAALVANLKSGNLVVA